MKTKREKKKRGPKPVKFSNDDVSKIEKMAAAGLTLDQIASIWDRNERTLIRYMHSDNRVKEAINSGRVRANLAIASVAYKQAASGKVPAMTMFWLKCRAGWREQQNIKFDGNLKVGHDLSARSTDDLLKMREKYVKLNNANDDDQLGVIANEVIECAVAKTDDNDK